MMRQGKMMSFDPNDTQHHEYVLEKVTRENGGWELQFDGGMCLYCPSNPVEPKAGALARLYGRGFGYSVRGIVIDGVVYRYETEDEESDRFKWEQTERKERRRREYIEQKPKNDARLAKLPKVFRDRIEKFRNSNADFGPELEGYELFCCEQAFVFAGTAIAAAGRENADKWLVNWARKDWENQRAEMRGMDDGHSGNTFGVSVSLARLYLNEESDVTRMHGAMAVVVGSKAYENSTAD